MATFTVSKSVAAPPAVVFAVLTDAEHLPEVIPAITKVEVHPPGPLAVGTKLIETRMMFGKPATETFTVTAFVPGERFTMEMLSCGVAYRCEHRFAPEGAGTRLDMTMQSRATTTYAKLFAPMAWLMKGMMKKMIAKDLDGVAAAAEKRAG